MVAASVSVSPSEACLVDSVGLVVLVFSITTIDSYNSSSRFSAGFLELHLMLGSESLYLLPSDAGGSLCDDSWANH